VARICRSHSSKEDQNRQGRGSIPRFGIPSFAVWRRRLTVRALWWHVDFWYFFEKNQCCSIDEGKIGFGDPCGDITNDKLFASAELNIVSPSRP
jgi:hypothetical protein